MWQQHTADDVPLDVTIGAKRARTDSAAHEHRFMCKQGASNPLGCILQRQR